MVCWVVFVVYFDFKSVGCGGVWVYQCQCNWVVEGGVGCVGGDVFDDFVVYFDWVIFVYWYFVEFEVDEFLSRCGL